MTYLDGLQAALAAEHASLFVVGYLGAQTSTSTQPVLAAALRDAYDAHRGRRDALEDLVTGAGGTPVAAAASYDVQDVGGDPTLIAARALAVEQTCGATYGFLVANSADDARRWAVTAVLDCAVRELAFGGRPRSYPGR